MISFLKTAFPEFQVRGEGTSRDSSRWVHVGTDDTYVSLLDATEASAAILEMPVSDRGTLGGLTQFAGFRFSRDRK